MDIVRETVEEWKPGDSFHRGDAERLLASLRSRPAQGFRSAVALHLYPARLREQPQSVFRCGNSRS